MSGTSNLLARGIAAAKAGKKEEARSILTRVLQRDADNEQAWLWLGAVVNSPRETLICLRRVLAINPDNEQAKEGIKWASAKLARAKTTPLVKSRPFPRNGEVKTPSEAISVSPLASRFRVIERAMTPSQPSGAVASPQPIASGISGKLSEAVLRTTPLSAIKSMIGYPSIGFRRWMSWIAIIVATLWLVYPFYWALITSFKRPMDVYHWYAIPFLHFKPTLRHWLLELGPGGSVMRYALINSLIISLGATAIAIVLGTMAGYGLARFRFQPWRNVDIALLFLLQRFLPPVVLVVPFALMMKALHLLDTPLSLILANATLTMPFAVLITHGVFKEMPLELEESALVDGCSRFAAFWRIALPLAVPAVAASAIICFAFAWNEFLFALILSYQKAKPVTVIMAGSGGIRIITHALTAIAPPLILILGAQKYIVRGLTLGMVKG